MNCRRGSWLPASIAVASLLGVPGAVSVRVWLLMSRCRRPRGAPAFQEIVQIEAIELTIADAKLTDIERNPRAATNPDDIELSPDDTRYDASSPRSRFTPPKCEV